MQRYKVEGMIKIEYTYYVAEEVEAENEDDAIDAICEEFLPGDEDRADYDTYGCKVTLIEDEDELPEDRRMRLLGAPTLPGFA
jgi:hypothetical protein